MTRPVLTSDTVAVPLGIPGDAPGAGVVIIHGEVGLVRVLGRPGTGSLIDMM